MMSPASSNNQRNSRLLGSGIAASPSGSRETSHWTYPDEDAIRRHEQLQRRREERWARRAEREEREVRDNKTRIMVASAFVCAGISLGVMTRIGENILSSVVYGAMIGVFVSLLAAIATALLGLDGVWDSSVLVDEWTEDYFDEEYDDYDDFIGLGDAMRSPTMSEDVPVMASFVPVSDDMLGASPQSREDMMSFINALAMDADASEEDIIV